MNDLQKFAADIRYFAEQAGIEVRRDRLEGEAESEFRYEPGFTAQTIIEDAADAGATVIYLMLEEDRLTHAVTAVAAWTDGDFIFRATLGSSDARLPEESGRGEQGPIRVSSVIGMAPPDSRYQDLPHRLKQVADAIAEDPRYEPREESGAEVLAQHTVGLAPHDRELVELAVPGRFETVFGPDLDTQADRWARRLLAVEGAVDLVEPGRRLEESITEHLPEVGVRLRRRVSWRVCEIVRESGLHDEAVARIEQVTSDVIESLPPPVRDRLGFTPRTAARLEVLSPYVEHLTPDDRWQLRWRAPALEAERYKASREARYATAAWVLVDDQGMSRTAAGRVLGISASVVTRLLRENPARVNLDSDDPLRDLHPALRDL